MVQKINKFKSQLSFWPGEVKFTKRFDICGFERGKTKRKVKRPYCGFGRGKWTESQETNLGKIFLFGIHPPLGVFFRSNGKLVYLGNNHEVRKIVHGILLLQSFPVLPDESRTVEGEMYCETRFWTSWSIELFHENYYRILAFKYCSIQKTIVISTPWLPASAEQHG